MVMVKRHTRKIENKWYKSQNMPTLLSWVRERKYPFETIVQVHYDRSFSPPWRMKVSRNYKFLMDKLFTKRIDAIKFARKWMKAHPKG